MRCAMCGTADWEWDPAQGGNRRAYEPVAHTCMGCRHKDGHAEGTTREPGVSIRLLPTGDRAHARRLMRAEEQWRRRKGEDDD